MACPLQWAINLPASFYGKTATIPGPALASRQKIELPEELRGDTNCGPTVMVAQETAHRDRTREHAVKLSAGNQLKRKVITETTARPSPTGRAEEIL